MRVSIGKTALGVAAGAALMLSLSGCVYYDDGYYDRYTGYHGGVYEYDGYARYRYYHGGAAYSYERYPYDGYYDGYYGPYYGGYWANDGFFYYRDANRRYFRDHDGHFRREHFDGGRPFRADGYHGRRWRY